MLDEQMFFDGILLLAFFLRLEDTDDIVVAGAFGDVAFRDFINFFDFLLVKEVNDEEQYELLLLRLRLLLLEEIAKKDLVTDKIESVEQLEEIDDDLDVVFVNIKEFELYAVKIDEQVDDDKLVELNDDLNDSAGEQSKLHWSKFSSISYEQLLLIFCFENFFSRSLLERNDLFSM
jgi:hypothetical protein